MLLLLLLLLGATPRNDATEGENSGIDAAAADADEGGSDEEPALRTSCGAFVAEAAAAAAAAAADGTTDPTLRSPRAAREAYALGVNGCGGEDARTLSPTGILAGVP